MSTSGDTTSGLLSRRDTGALSPVHVCVVSVVALVVGTALAVAVGRDVLAPVNPTDPFGPSGLWLLAVLGLVDDAGVERLIEKIRRVEAGETGVEFSTERDGGLGRLYAAVGDLAENVTDRERERNERYRRRLHELTTDPSLDDEQTVRELLELGRERFGLANGLVTRVDAETGRYEVETAVGTDFVEAGTVTDLEDTFCRRTIEADDVVATYDASETDAGADPGHTEWGISAYLGAKILVDDELYGTVCFVDPDPRTEPFSPEERLFADLLGRWISHVYERRGRQRDVRESSERLGATIQASPAAIVAIDADGTVQLWNPAAERIFGWSAQEVVGDPLPIVPEDESDEYEQFRERLLSGGSIERFETERLTADGDLIDVTLSAAPMYDEGEVVGVVGVFEDISDRRAAERELRETTRKLEIALEGTNTGVWEWDLETDEAVWDRTLEELLGLEPGGFEGTYAAFEERVHPDDLSAVEAAVDRAIEGCEIYQTEFRIRHEDGGWVWVGARGQLVEDGSAGGSRDGDERMVGILNDISERKEHERELERYREYTDDLLDAIDDVFYVLDEDGRVLRWNESLVEVTGYTDEEIAGTCALELFDEGERDRVANAIEEVFETGDTRVESAFSTKDGRKIPYEFAAVAMEDLDGETVVVGVGRDVSERVRYERELERTRNLLEQSQRLTNVGGWEITVEDGKPVDPTLTEEACRILGLPPDCDVGHEGALERIHPDDRPRLDADLQRAFEDGEGYDHEVRVLTPDGDLRWVRAIGDPILEDGETVAVYGSVQDITERTERERELERTTDLLGLTQEMADVGGWSVDLSGEPPLETEWTDRLYDIFELPRDAAPPTMDVFEYYHPDDRDRHEAAVERAIEETGSWDQELRLVTAEGTERWVRNIGETVSEDGEVVEIRGSVQDVTERREREEALRGRERELQAHKEYTDDVLDAIDDVFYVIDDEGTFLRWNESLPRAGGYTDEEIAETNALEFFADADRPAVVEAMESVFAEGGSRRVEASILTKDGETVPYEFVAATVENPEDETVLAGIGRDISERKRREAALERTTELLGQAQRIAAVGGWEFDVATETFTITDEFRRLHGLDPEGPVTLEDVVSQYHPDEREYVRQVFEETIETGEGYDMEVRIRPDAGTTRWVRALGEPVVRDGEVVKLRGSVQDVTDEKEHEQALRALHETAEGLLQRESASAVADLVVGTAADILDVDGVCLYLLDEGTNSLVPTAHTEEFAAGGDVPPVPVGDEDNPVWNSFATSTRRVLDEGDGAAGLFPETVGGALVVPVGNHGVLAITTREPGIAARTRRLVETLVATTEAALDRLESEAAVRERDEALAEQNRRLRRQIQLTDVIRRVDQSLIEADSRVAVETAVTEELAAADDIDFAWIGTVDPGDDCVEPGTWAGSGESYLDAVSLALGDGEAEPAALAAHTGEPTVVSNVVADLQGNGWRKTALDSGFTSVLAVPIALEEYGYGVLAVYAGQPDAFGDLEREVFAELGRTIASAINAVQTREALHADRLLELRLSFGDSESFLAQVARAADCPVEYVGTAGPSEDGTRLFFAAECDASDALADLVTVARFRQLSEADGRYVYEASVTGDVLPAKLIRHGASPESIRATPTELSVVVHVPTGTDVREFVEMLRESYRTVELESRRTVERPTRTRQQIVGDLLADLTDRQREVLRTAYYAGFFDWPRGTTGEELAEMLGVTQPTVSRHLRLGQEHLLAQLFNEEVVPAVA